MSNPIEHATRTWLATQAIAHLIDVAHLIENAVNLPVVFLLDEITAPGYERFYGYAVVRTKGIEHDPMVAVVPPRVAVTVPRVR